MNKTNRFIYSVSIINLLLFIYTILYLVFFVDIKPMDIEFFQSSVNIILIISSSLIGFILIFYTIYINMIEIKRERIRNRIREGIVEHPELALIGISCLMEEIIKFIPKSKFLNKATLNFLKDIKNIPTLKYIDKIKLKIQSRNQKKLWILIIMSPIILIGTSIDYIKYMIKERNKLYNSVNKLKSECFKKIKLDKYYNISLSDFRTRYDFIGLMWAVFYCVLTMVICLLITQGVDTTIQIENIDGFVYSIEIVNDVLALHLLKLSILLMIFSTFNCFIFFIGLFKKYVLDPEDEIGIIIKEIIEETKIEKGTNKKKDFWDNGGIW